MLACQRFRVRFWVVTCNFPFSFSRKNFDVVKKIVSVAKRVQPFTKGKRVATRLISFVNGQCNHWLALTKLFGMEVAKS